MRFDEFDFSYDLLDALDAMRFEECTPIQAQAMGPILEGRDIIACAQTGTGKTAAYLLPVIDLLADYPNENGKVRCVVMVPTHELAQQIDRQLEGFSYYLPVSSLAIHGGNDGKEFARQQNALRKGADIVIATPGRLLAHIKMGYVDLSGVEYFILDEADRMLDMGFSDDIMRIVAEIPKERQTLMFSATMPRKIQQLAETILIDPAEVRIAVSKPNENIDQSAFIVHEGQKAGLLKHLFETTYSQRVIVFSGSKQKVKELTAVLRKSKWKAAEMHSDLDQKAREEVMLDFRAGRVDILVATDILSRGIDVDDITMVVNYDVPHEAEDYVHRIGRTARASNHGKAVTFVSERDQSRFGQIENFLGNLVRKEDIPEEFGAGPEYRPERGDRGRGRANGGRGGKSGKGRKDRPRREKSAPKATEKPAAETAEPTASPAPSVPEGEAKAKKRKKRRWYGPKKQS
ncbi:MAG: DEAD/DEAH box helicase [Bacteroidales bacterium]|nr:DEAD/DEAH box helicase [Bacteroidales bacterium]